MSDVEPNVELYAEQLKKMSAAADDLASYFNSLVEALAPYSEALARFLDSTFMCPCGHPLGNHPYSKRRRRSRRQRCTKCGCHAYAGLTLE